jgi:hypothetical protein
MDGYLSNNPDNFVDDPDKHYRLRRREAQAKKLEFADSIAEGEGSSESPKESPPQSLGRTDFHRWEIGELCTPDIIDLLILNLT